MEFTCSAQQDSLDFTIVMSSEKYRPWWQKIEIVFFGFQSSPREVLLDGNRSEHWRFDPATHTVTLSSVAL
jgi:hypothetical protein